MAVLAWSVRVYSATMCGGLVDFVKCLMDLIPVSRHECKFHSRIEDVRLCN